MKAQSRILRVERISSPIVILSPSESAIPCVLLRILICPVTVPFSVRSMLRFASASSPIEQQLLRNCSTQQTKRQHTKQTPRVHVRRQKVAIPRECAFWGQARHISGFHDMFKILPWITISAVRILLTEVTSQSSRNRAVHIDAIFPFKLCPHATELLSGANQEMNTES